MRMTLGVLTLALLVSVSALCTQISTPTFDIYVIDVEGGNATLFVSPSGESLLMDTGNGGVNADRDASRIMDAVRAAGLDAIDYLVTTHWHGDHFGALAELSSRIPVRNFVDHGPSVQPNPQTDAFIAETYPALYASATRQILAPGDSVTLGAARFDVLASGGQVRPTPLPGRGTANPYCEEFVPQAEDTGENAQSLGGVFTFGEFRVLHLGDLTVNKEFALMCPENPIGRIDVFIVSHHGQPSSNSEVLVHATEPRVGVMNNGTRKGGQPDAMRVLYSSPGMEDLWQLHFSLLSGQEYTVPGLFIANSVDDAGTEIPIAPLEQGRGGGGAAPAHEGPAHWIRISASPDGSFSVANTRNGFEKAYAAR